MHVSNFGCISSLDSYPVSIRRNVIKEEQVTELCESRREAQSVGEEEMNNPVEVGAVGENRRHWGCL